MLPLSNLALAAGLSGGVVNAITLDATDSSSIKDSAKTVATEMMTYYTGWRPGDNPGNLPSPYYWWEAGGMFGHMVDYWYYTGDEAWNDQTVQAITWQAGTEGNFMPANQTNTEGNDDQVFWAFTAMNAAELNFKDPGDKYPSYLAMAQAVFNLQAARWDPGSCNGGLRWQIFQWNSGYDYKNVASNGGFFQLAARLARYTDNSTYVDWAEKTWDWFSASVLYDSKSSSVYDGTSDKDNCSEADHSQWTYNYGLYLCGLAYLYNHTENEKWLTPMQGMLDTTLKNFFPTQMGDKIMVEVNCEPLSNCNNDNYTFKGFTLRWLALVAQLVPSLADQIWPYIQASAVGAAGQCSGGANGTTCGFEWNSTTWDGLSGVGQQMSALAAIDANMILQGNLKAPYTTATGGTSKGDPSAGTGNGDENDPVSKIYTRKITTADRAGAAILTILCLAFTLLGAFWLLSGL